jgi:hypothetical protein
VLPAGEFEPPVEPSDSAEQRSDDRPSSTIHVPSSLGFPAVRRQRRIRVGRYYAEGDDVKIRVEWTQKSRGNATGELEVREKEFETWEDLAAWVAEKREAA